MAAETDTNPAEAQAQRLESVVEQLEALLRQPEVARRLRAAPDENEWTAMQILGHLVEMIPYWLRQARSLIEATGEPLPFGRMLDNPERLAGVERGAAADPDELLRQLRDEAQAAAAAIRRLSPAERARTGLHPRRGEMSVNDLIEEFITAHAEDHLAQMRAALGN